jgi:hypothetical protein
MGIRILKGWMLPFALHIGVVELYLYLLFRNINRLQPIISYVTHTHTQRVSQVGWIHTKLLTMILLPCSKTDEVGSVAIGAGTALALAEVCLVPAAAAAALLILNPRLPLRIPRLRGLEEMMSGDGVSRSRGYGVLEYTIKTLIQGRHGWRK